MKNFLARFILCVLVVASLFYAVGCGAGAEGTSTPPVDIPSPVSHLSVSSPDSDGMVRVSGDAGFADALSTISISHNGTTTASLMDLFVSKAFAQLVTTTTASGDGSFRVAIAASIGDSISVTYTNDGVESTTQKIVPDNQPPLPESANIQDAAVNASAGVAGIVANDGANGFLHLLNLNDGVVSQTVMLTGAANANRVSFDSVTGNYSILDAELQDVFTVSPNGAVLSAAIDTPLDMAYALNGHFAIVTHSTGDYAACFFNADLNVATSLVEVTVPGGAAHVTTPVIAADLDGSNDVFAIVSLMNDDVNYAVLFEVQNATTYTQRAVVALTGVNEVGGISLFNNGTEALITDTLNDRVLRVNFELAEITSSITVGDAPLGVVANVEGTLAYVANGADSTVSVLSLDANTVSVTESVGLTATEVALDRTQASSPVVVVNTGDETVSLP